MNILKLTLRILSVLCLVMVISCSKEKVDRPQQLKLTTKPLPLSRFQRIGENYEQLKLQTTIASQGKKMNVIGNKVSVVDPGYNEMLEPIIENGRLFHEELVAQLSTSPAWLELTEEERDSIIDYDDSQLAQLSFVMSISASQSSADWPRVRSCASAALGIAGITELWTNTLALGTVETAIGALKLIGRRYMGYIGIALMIYDFADCYGG